jgi:class 3 adenylate cyclase/tetratricopeptide (TPR) repeat protein
MALATGTAPVLDASETDGEQRRVTLMFADISGSTELVEHLNPEEAANLLDPMIAAMTETAERYAGSVSPRGDGILAMFGGAGAAEDNAVRACLAALEILRRLDDAKPRVRIGIHHGEVALLSGRRGPSRENFFGPAIHIAARLEQTAEPGSASLSTEAFELVRDFVQAEPLPPVQAKGISHPLARFRLLGVRATSRWRARLGRGLTPFIDRNVESAALAEFLQRAVGPGAHLLQVLGQAGIGKSRLVHEALRTEAASACCVITLAGPIHRGHPGYDPLTQWLRDLARDSGGWNAEEQPSAQVEKLPGAASLTIETKEQLVRYLGLGEVSHVRVADLDAIASVSIIAPIASIIVEMARGRRVLMACEDAETLDNRSLDHIAALSAAVAERGPIVMLVLSSRRALKLPADRFITRKTLRLPALEPDVARQMLARIHPETRRRSELADTILAKADGNPLFLEEVSALLQTRSAGQDADDADGSAIPDRIEALIADRLARIPQQAQTLLRVCSVLGSSFSPDLLPAVSGQSAGLVQEHLARLKTEHLLHDDAAASTPRVSFNHLLVRDVAYRTLLPSRRRAIHEKVLRWLERSDLRRDPDDLAHHAVNARLWPEALRYLQQAAVAAAERAGYSSAERHLRQALKIAELLPQDRAARTTMVEIMVGLRSLLALDLRHDEADHLLDRAQALAEDLEPAQRLSIMVKRIRALNTRGHLREATAVATEARRDAGAIGHVALQLAAMHFQGQTCFYTGRFSAGDATLTEAARMLRDSADASDVAVGNTRVLIPATRAGMRSFVGRFSEAAQDVAQAIAIATAKNAPYDLCFARFAAGVVRLQQRHLAEAEDEFRLGLEGAERHSLRALLPWLNAGLGHTLLLGGSTNAAIAALTEAHEVAKESGRVLSQMSAAIGLIAAYGGTGGLTPALRYAEEAVQLGARHTLRALLVAALRGRGAVLAARENTRKAGIHSVRQALALARKLGTKPDVAHCLATLAAISGCSTVAAEAEAAYRQIGMGPWAQRVIGAGAASVSLSIIAA